MPLDDVRFNFRQCLLDEIHHLNERERALIWNTALAFVASVFFWITLALVHLQWWWTDAGPVPAFFTGIMMVGVIFSIVKAVSFAERRRSVSEGLSAARYKLDHLAIG